MTARAYKHEEVAKTPRGYHVRSVQRGTHVVRVAFPPGPRRKGAGKVVEILHPKSEMNPSCIVSNQVRSNPGELIIFGNPQKRMLTKAEAKKKNTSSQAAKRATRERAARIRKARLNPKGGFGTHKKGCGCVFCKHQREIAAADAKMPKQVRDVMRSNPRRRRKNRRNPDETRAAVRLFEKFHGRDPKEITEKHVSAAVRQDYTALGDLEHLKVITPLGQTLQFNFEGDGVKLASSPDGKQLYCIGGNQNLSGCLDKESLEKDFIDLGECVQVQYLARKVHANFEPVSYYHKFGENTGVRPQLAYDKLKKQIFFVGGEYFIDTKQGVSPGIEN